MNHSALTAIVVAGGLSSRMKDFKPLLTLGEDTFVNRVIRLFRRMDIKVFLVGGYRCEELFAAVSDKDVILQANPDYEQGMFTSILKGTEQLDESCRGFFIQPADIPLVRQTTVRRLVEAFETDPDKIIYPVFQEQRGHPTLVPASLIQEIKNWQGEGGLRAVLQHNEDRALELTVADRFILMDVDTPDDYQKLLSSYETYDIPDDEECRAICEDIYGTRPDIVAHGNMVARVATAIGEQLVHAGLNVDLPLIQASAKLHDIAKGQPRHDAAGGQLLRGLGFSRVGNIVGVHTDLAEHEVSLEARIVYLADKLVRGDQVVGLEERYLISEKQYGKDPDIALKVAQRKRRAQETAAEIESLAGRSLTSIIEGAIVN